MAGQTNEQTRRSNPQLTDWLAAVIGTNPNSPQNGGTDALIQAEDLMELFFGNISVTSNENGVSVVVAGKFQVCWAYLILEGLAAGETLDYVWTYPTPFPLSSPLPVVIPVASMTSNFHRNASPSSASGDWTRESAKLFIQDHRTTGSSVSNRVFVAAFSRL